MRRWRKTAFSATWRTPGSVTRPECRQSYPQGMQKLDALRTTGSLSSSVRERARFIVRQATHRDEAALYRLRRSGIRIHLRHATPDINAFDQIFRLGHYRPPEAVEQILSGTEKPLRV